MTSLVFEVRRIFYYPLPLTYGLVHILDATGRSDNIPDNFQYSQQRFNINRHQGSVNVCYMDGHVDKVNLKGLWNLKWHKQYDLTESLPTWPEWMRGFKD